MFQQEVVSEVDNISIGPLRLTSGENLSDVSLRYERVGPVGAPVILVCHALTGNHRTVGEKKNPGWWSGLIGEDSYINTDAFQVITFNVLGGCDGSTGPLSKDPETQEMYQSSFPEISIRDMVKAQSLALEKLNISELHAVIGGSLGGMQVFEWGLSYPHRVNKLIILAATPVFSDYGIAFNHIAETAIKNDPKWKKGLYKKEDALPGLEVARMIGMVTYRSPDLFTKRFKRRKPHNRFEVTSYLNYQGEKLTKRFDANSYLCLLQAMNQHDIGAGHNCWQQACQKLTMPTLMLSFDKDLIYEPLKIEQCSRQSH